MPGPYVFDDSDLRARLMKSRASRGADETYWEKANKPLWEAPSRWGKEFEDWVTEPTMDDQTTTSNIGGFGTYGKAMAKGFLGGAAKGAGEFVSGLTSPLNLAITAATMGSGGLAKQGFTSAARGLGYGAKALGAVQGAHGLYDIGGGLSEGDWSRAGRGGTEALAGAIGMHTPIPDLPGRATVTEVPIPKPKAPKLLGPVEEPRLGLPAQAGEGAPPPSGRSYGSPRTSPRVWMGQDQPGFTATRAGITTPENPVQGVIEVGRPTPVSAGMGRTPDAARAAFEGLVPDRYKRGTAYDPSGVTYTPTLGDISGPPTPGLPTLSEGGNLLTGAAQEASRRAGQPTMGIREMVEQYGVEETARRARMTPTEVKSFMRGEPFLQEPHEAPSTQLAQEPPPPPPRQPPPQEPPPPRPTKRPPPNDVRGMSPEVLEALANRGHEGAAAEITRRAGVRGQRTRPSPLERLGEETGAVGPGANEIVEGRRQRPSDTIIQAIKRSGENVSDLLGRGFDFFADRVSDLMSNQRGMAKTDLLVPGAERIETAVKKRRGFTLDPADVEETWRRLQRVERNNLDVRYAVGQIGSNRGTPGWQESFPVRPESTHTGGTYYDSQGRPVLRASLSRHHDDTWGITTMGMDPNVTGLGAGKAQRAFQENVLGKLGVRGAHGSISPDTVNMIQHYMTEASGKPVGQLDVDFAPGLIERPIPADVAKTEDLGWQKEARKAGMSESSYMNLRQRAIDAGIDWTDYPDPRVLSKAIDNLVRFRQEIKPTPAEELWMTRNRKNYIFDNIEDLKRVIMKSRDLGINIEQAEDAMSLRGAVRDAEAGRDPSRNLKLPKLGDVGEIRDERAAQKAIWRERRKEFIGARKNALPEPRSASQDFEWTPETAPDEYDPNNPWHEPEAPPWDPNTGVAPASIRRLGDAGNMDRGVVDHILRMGEDTQEIEALHRAGDPRAEELYQSWARDYQRAQREQPPARRYPIDDALEAGHTGPTSVHPRDIELRNLISPEVRSYMESQGYDPEGHIALERSQPGSYSRDMWETAARDWREGSAIYDRNPEIGASPDFEAYLRSLGFNVERADRGLRGRMIDLYRGRLERGNTPWRTAEIPAQENSDLPTSADPARSESGTRRGGLRGAADRLRERIAGATSSIPADLGAGDETGAIVNPFARQRGGIRGPGAAPRAGGGLGNPAEKVLKAINSARVASMLTGLAAPKSLLGNVGSHIIASMENRTTAPLRELTNFPEHWSNFKTGWQQGANPAQTGGFSKLNVAGRFMGAADHAATESLKRAGLSQAEAENILLTSPNAASQALGLNTALGEMAVPFRKIPFNQFKEGMTRYAKHPAIYAGAGALGALGGAMTDDPEKIALLAATAGPYALPVTAGATLTGGARMTQGLSPIPEWGLVRTFMEPWAPFTRPPGLRWLPEDWQKAWEDKVKDVGLGKGKSGSKKPKNTLFESTPRGSKVKNALVR